MRVKVKGISQVDGSTVEVELNPLKIPSLLIKYNYSTNASPPPNSSQVRTDSVDAYDATKIWLHRIDNENRDVKYFLMQMVVGKRVYVQDIDNSDSYALFTLVDDPIDEGSYVTLNVKCEHASEVSLQGTALLIGLII